MTPGAEKQAGASNCWGGGCPGDMDTGGGQRPGLGRGAGDWWGCKPGQKRKIETVEEDTAFMLRWLNLDHKAQQARRQFLEWDLKRSLLHKQPGQPVSNSMTVLKSQGLQSPNTNPRVLHDTEGV